MPANTFRANICETIPAGSSHHLVRIAGTDRQFILPSSGKQMLDACQAPGSIPSLVDRIMSVFGVAEQKRPAVEQALNALCAQGLLVKTEALLPAASPSTRPHRNVSSAVFPTADRTSDLQAAILSYGRSFEECGRRVEMIVMDDSKAESIRPEYLSLLRSCDLPRKPRYAGRKEKRAYVEELARAGIDPDIARFAVLGDFPGLQCKYTAGANRNAILLDTVGEYIFTADDDTISKYALHPDHCTGLRLTGHAIPRDMWFYKSRDAVMQAARWAPCDILIEHERLLGKNLGEIVGATKSGQLDLSEACDHVLWAMQDDRAIVSVTMSGVAGDSGGYSGKSLLGATGPTRTRLCESASTFRTALDSREVIGVVPCHTLSHHWLCIATTLGLANVELLPPFFPVCWNEDGVFGVLNSLTRSFCFGHIPVAVLHNADPRRRYAANLELRFSDLLCGLIYSVTQAHRKDPRPWHSRDASALLSLLGRELDGIAALPEQEWLDLVCATATWGRSEFVRQSERLLTAFPDYPAYWKAEVSSFCQYLLAELTNPDRFIPVEFRTGEPAGVIRQRMRALIRKAADLFRSWPDLMAAALELKKKDVRLSADIRQIKD